MPPTLRTSISANYCQGSRVKQPQLAAQLRTFEAALPINVNSPVMAMSSSDQSRAQASQNPRKPCCNFSRILETSQATFAKALANSGTWKAVLTRALVLGFRDTLA